MPPSTYEQITASVPALQAGRSSLEVPIVLRAAAVAGLAATAGIHLRDLSDKFAETPYLGVGYAALIIAAVAAAVMIVKRQTAGWLLAGAACALTIAGFVLTRTTGLPAATGDIGNWGEAVGIYALVAEAVVVATASFALITRRAPR